MRHKSLRSLQFRLLPTTAFHYTPEPVSTASTTPDWKIDAAKAEREAKEGEALTQRSEARSALGAGQPGQELVCPVTADGHHDVCYWRDINDR
jgi:hypothetical protein